MKSIDMFSDLKPPRKKREWLMHVIDCGNSNCDGLEDKEQLVVLKCNKCGHESGWITLPNITIAKRGISCPKCNNIKNENPSL